MEKKAFHIIKLNDSRLLVILLSFDSYSEYWDELCSTLASYNMTNAELYFDYLVRNGLNERFFRTKLDGLSLIPNSFSAFEAGPLVVSESNKYFREHPESLQSSALSEIQRKLFLRRLSRQN